MHHQFVVRLINNYQSTASEFEKHCSKVRKWNKPVGGLSDLAGTNGSFSNTVRGLALNAAVAFIFLFSSSTYKLEKHGNL